MVKREKSVNLEDLKRRIEEAIEEFNRYRSPEATAKLVKISKKNFKVDFSGPFCRTCGFYDYFDDLKIILEERGILNKISKVEEKEDGSIVSFSL